MSKKSKWQNIDDVEMKKQMYTTQRKLKNQNRFFDFKNSTNSFVVNIFTIDCSLKCGSFDQIGHLSNASDNAKYSVSLGSGINAFAFSRNFSNFDFSTTFKVISSLSISNSISFTCKDEADSILDLCSLNSSNKNSGVNNSSLSEKSNVLVTPLPINPVNKTVASTINFKGGIYFNPGYSFLYLSCNPLLTSLPNSSASFSVSLDFATIDLNILYSATFSDMAFLAISDQFNSGNDSISDFNSFGIASVNVGILFPPDTFNTHITSNYVQVYKSFG